MPTFRSLCNIRDRVRLAPQIDEILAPGRSALEQRATDAAAGIAACDAAFTRLEHEIAAAKAKRDRLVVHAPVTYSKGIAVRGSVIGYAADHAEAVAVAREHGYSSVTLDTADGGRCWAATGDPFAYPGRLDAPGSLRPPRTATRHKRNREKATRDRFRKVRSSWIAEVAAVNGFLILLLDDGTAQIWGSPTKPAPEWLAEVVAKVGGRTVSRMLRGEYPYQAVDAGDVPELRRMIAGKQGVSS